MRLPTLNRGPLSHKSADPAGLGLAVWLVTWTVLLSGALAWPAWGQTERDPAASSAAERRSATPRGVRTTPAAGGGAQADFDSLIDLITATIAPDTWDDVGGEGSIQGFPGGVYVDSQGVLRQVDQATTQRLAPRWQKWNLKRQRVFGEQDAARPSPLRKVSLADLLLLCRQMHDRQQPPTDEMLHMAGLQRIDYLIFNAARSDCIVAGPAGAWVVDRQGRHVAAGSGRPVVRLEDLVVLLQNALSARGQFLCAITPTEAGLAQAQQYIAASSGRAVPVGGRQAWLNGFRSALGLQRIEVEGIEANTRVARVIVEADHHMKRVGIGLEPGTDRVSSYLERIVRAGEIPERMDVLRWWFTLHPQAVEVWRRGELYAFGEQAVQVLSENELLTRSGQRVPTGRSDPLNEEFARDFTADFVELARRYPIYGDLDNVFRLALVAAIIQQQGFPARDDFELADWLRSGEFPVTTARAPAWVESIVNHRQVDRRRFVAVVSGGVRFAAPSLTSLPASAASQAPAWRTAERTGQTRQTAAAGQTAPAQSQTPRWWWD